MPMSESRLNDGQEEGSPSAIEGQASRLRTLLIRLSLAGLVSTVAGGAVAWCLATGSLSRSTFQAYAALLGRLSALSFFGSFPVELFAAWWFLVALVLLAASPPAIRPGLATYGFLFSIPALGYYTWIWLSFAPRHAFNLFVSTAALVAFVGITATSDLTSVRAARRRLAGDAAAFLKSSPAAVSLVLALLLPAGLVWRISDAAGRPALAENDRADFLSWYALQVRQERAQATAEKTVRVIEFHDYQCGPCRAFFDHTRPTIDPYPTPAGARVHLEVRDFPLDASCNRAVSNSIHPVACQAAAAVRIAASAGKRDVLEKWLFANQGALTTALLETHLASLGLLPEYRAGYDSAISQVREDIELAQALNVNGTPTVFVNGVRLRNHETARWAIERELSSLQ
jgi:hypothetical protein